MTSALFRKTLYLIWGDEPDRLRLIQTLENDGFRVVPYSTPEAFLSQHRSPHGPAEFLLLQSLATAGRDDLQFLRNMGVALPVIVVADQGSVQDAVAALRQGAADFLVAPVTAADVRRSVSEVLQAKPRRMVRIDGAEQASQLAGLTRCERNVLDCILSAMTTKQISSTMQIGLQTVSKHKQRILRKLGVRNEVELVLQLVTGERGPAVSAASA